jgi:ribosomal protein L24E
MSNKDYLLDYRDLQQGSIQSMLTRIDAAEGINLKELRVQDLSFYNGKPIYPGTGVYLFRKGKKIVYVGKCSSMSFTERIAKHFDFRTYAWMNRLLKLVCQKELQLEETHDNLKIAAQYAFENLNLVLIHFNQRDRINRTERLLKACSKSLNCFKKLRVKNLEAIVDTY